MIIDVDLTNKAKPHHKKGNLGRNFTFLQIENGNHSLTEGVYNIRNKYLGHLETSG